MKKITLKNLHSINKVGHILPALMVFATRKSRKIHKLHFNWRENVSHSLMMCYYYLFGRKIGIRNGGLTWYQNSDGLRVVWINTWFGILMFLEHEVIRASLRKRLVVKPFNLFIPALATFDPYGFTRQVKHPFLFSIAFEEAEGFANGTSNNPVLANVEGSGVDSLLTGQLNWNNSRTFNTDPNFGGSNLTIIASQVNTADGNPDIWSGRLVNPSTTPGNFSAVFSGSASWNILATTYSGIDQTTPTADETSNVGGPYNLASPLTFADTSNKSGSWQWVSCKQDSGAASIVATVGQRRQGQSAGTVTNALLDGNVGVASGNNGDVTITWSSGGQLIGYQSCMLRPSVEDVTGGGLFLFL